MSKQYKVAGQTIKLEEDPNFVAVRYKEPAPHSTRAAVAAAAGASPFEARYEVPGEKYTLLPVAPVAGAAPARQAATIRRLQDEPQVSRAAPVYRFEDKQVVATERVMFGFQGTAKEARALIKKIRGTVVSSQGSEYVVRLPEGEDPFAAAEALSKVKAVEYAEPDLVTIGRHLARPPSPPRPAAPGGDPLLPQQYAPHLTRAVEAWQVQSGDPGIRIAILDEGVDTRHEDLRACIVGAYDGADDDEFQEPNPWDAHGTACAGLAAAVPNNSQGIRGIGGGASLLAVRIAYSNGPKQDWTTASSWIARAIDWAWRNGADVLSNSWGGGPPAQAIINAFGRARTQGRGGKGSVIVIAAGNSFGPVGFPGNLPDVLTVSASNEWDQFKTPTSHDGETWWGSCFGAEIGLAAPGVHNLTTDITGTGGYNVGNYYPIFNGTSSATPLVAGAAALVLSARPSLTEREVREILQHTADKVGAQPYLNGRNDQFGFGRLNVLAAVQAARGMGEAAVAEGAPRLLAEALPLPPPGRGVARAGRRRRGPAGGKPSYDQVLARLLQALDAAHFPRPFDEGTDAIVLTGSKPILISLVNDTFFPGNPRFTAGDVAQGDNLGQVALAIRELLP